MAYRSNAKYGLLFLASSAALCYVASRGHFWQILLWPAVSCGVVAFAYLTGVVALLGKRRDGTRSWIAALVLAPYIELVRLFGALHAVLSREPACQAVGETLFVARRLRALQYPFHLAILLDLTAEICDPWSIRTSEAYRCYPILDAGAVSPEELVALVRSLNVPHGRRLLVHCALGHGRTGMVAAAWLVVYGGAKSADEAIAMLQSVRPRIRLNRRQRAALDGAVEMMQADAKPVPSPESAADAVSSDEA